ESTPDCPSRPHNLDGVSEKASRRCVHSAIRAPAVDRVSVAIGNTAREIDRDRREDLALFEEVKRASLRRPEAAGDCEHGHSDQSERPTREGVRFLVRKWDWLFDLSDYDRPPTQEKRRRDG